MKIRNKLCAAYQKGDFDELDSAPLIPRSRLIRLSPVEDRAPRMSWEPTIFYVMHVRGCTKLHPDVPEKYRGTFRCPCELEVIAQVRKL